MRIYVVMPNEVEHYKYPLGAGVMVTDNQQLSIACEKYLNDKAGEGFVMVGFSRSGMASTFIMEKDV